MDTDGQGLKMKKAIQSIDTARLRRVFIDHRFTQMDTDLEPVARIIKDDSKSSYSYSAMTTSRDVKYKLSPRVKALEMEFVCPDNLSEDYKKEITEGRINKGYVV